MCVSFSLPKYNRLFVLLSNLSVFCLFLLLFVFFHDLLFGLLFCSLFVLLSCTNNRSRCVLAMVVVCARTWSAQTREEENETASPIIHHRLLAETPISFLHRAKSRWSHRVWVQTCCLARDISLGALIKSPPRAGSGDALFRGPGPFG